MKWLAAAVLGLLLAGAVVVWRPYIHRAIGSRIHVPERGR